MFTIDDQKILCNSSLEASSPGDILDQYTNENIFLFIDAYVPSFVCKIVPTGRGRDGTRKKEKGAGGFGEADIGNASSDKSVVNQVEIEGTK